MQPLRGAISNMLCCFGFRGHENSRQSSSPHSSTANKDTPVSMSVHGATVPYAINSQDALHKIFASNSSTRGYNAVHTVPQKRPVAQGSLDLNFRFGWESPRKKAHGRLEHLTHHIKQKLSESKLSRNSEQADTSATAPMELATTSLVTESGAATQLLSHSQKSLGLTELLTSRAASEGGYDSDARSIRTPTILSAAGTFRIGQKFVRKSLATIEGSQADEQPVHSNNAIVAPAIVSVSPENSVSKPSTLPETPTRIAFLDAIQAGLNESPGDVLRRLSNGMANGTIKMPNTPELRALRMPSIDTVGSEWHLSLPAPQRTSSLHGERLEASREHQGFDMDQTLKRLADRVQQAKGESAAISSTHSLFSELDPALLEYMERFGKLCPYDEPVELSSPMTAIKVNSKPDTTGEMASSMTSLVECKLENNHGPDKISSASADIRSLHLFDMRISQRLASNSRVPMLSSNGSNNTSSQSLAPTASRNAVGKSRTSSVGRVPTFITIEHNRRPSDPDTRNLFEPPKPTRFEPMPKRFPSDGSTSAPIGLHQESLSIVDDSSSYYGSVIEGSTNGHGLSHPPTRRGSIKNTNSLAVGGRSASGPITRPFATGALGGALNLAKKAPHATNPVNLSQASEGSWRSPHEALWRRDGSMPKVRKFIKIDTTPTPVSRRLHTSTDANEEMSDIGVDRLLCRSRDNHGSDSTQAIEDRRNENFSDINPSTTGFSTALQGSKIEAGDAWLSQGRRTGWGFDFANSTPKKGICELPPKSEEQEQNNQPIPDGQDNTSHIWHKAFQRLAEPADHGRLLATPHFDREGRRKSSTTSVSDQGQSARKHSVSPAAHRRSQSADTDRQERCPEAQSQKQRRKSVPLLASLGSNSKQKKTQTLAKRGKLRKTSFVQLNQGPTDSEIRTGACKSSSAWEGLGIWGRFAIHTRDQRNGPAGSVEKVNVRDFYDEDNIQSCKGALTTTIKPASPLGLRSRGSWNMLTLAKPMLNRYNTKSMTFAISSADRAKQRRKGIAGKFRRLYRTKSSGLHAYAMTQGHRSSVSTGLSVEYPELECLPGGGALKRGRLRQSTSRIGEDGVTERERGASLDTISERTSKRSKSMHSHTIPWSKKDADEWSKLYQDCVGSLSALKSDDDIGHNDCGVASAAERRVLSLTSVLRHSTVNFEAELKKEADAAKETLLQQLRSSEDSEKGRRMPGSFV